MTFRTTPVVKRWLTMPLLWLFVILADPCEDYMRAVTHRWEQWVRR